MALSPDTGATNEAPKKTFLERIAVRQLIKIDPATGIIPADIFAFAEEINAYAESHPKTFKFYDGLTPDLIEDPEDADNQIPTLPIGFNLLISPLLKRNDKRGEVKQVVGAFIAQVPSFDLLMAEGERGIEYIYGKAVLGDCELKIKNSIRADGSHTIPTTLSDYIEQRKKGNEGVATFNEYAESLLPKLKKLGMKSITKVVLKQCLMNKEAAKINFGASIEDADFWINILDNMIAKGKREKKPVIALEQWRDNRDQPQELMRIDEDFDIASLFDEDGESDFDTPESEDGDSEDSEAETEGVGANA